MGNERTGGIPPININPDFASRRSGEPAEDTMHVGTGASVEGEWLADQRDHERPHPIEGTVRVVKHLGHAGLQIGKAFWFGK